MASEKLGSELILFADSRLYQVVKLGSEKSTPTPILTDRLAKFRGHDPTPNQEAAAVVAINAILWKIDGLPKYLQLLSHTDTEAINLVGTKMSLSKLHSFEIEADGERYLVKIYGLDILSVDPID